MSDTVLKKTTQQLGESAKKVVKDAGTQITDIPRATVQEAGRHIVAHESPRGFNQDASNTPAGEVSTEEIESQDKRRLAKLRKQLKTIEVGMERARHERGRRDEERITNTERSMHEEQRKKDERLAASKLSPGQEKIRSRQGTREIGRRPTG